MQFLEQAKEVCQDLLFVDSHHDILMDVLSRHQRGERGALSGYWAPIMTTGGINVQVLPVYVDDRFLPGLGLREIMRTLQAAEEDIASDDSRMELATDVAEIRQITDRGKIAGVLALEGCDGLGGDNRVLRALCRLGVRMVAFTWERRNAFADGTGERNPGGLTAAGRAALKDLRDNRVIFDVSHLAEPGFWDAIDIVEEPLVASHSNARAVFDHPRNLSDDQIRAIADCGGVIGLNFYGGYISDPPTCARMADHLQYMVELVGIEHFGIGADFLEGTLREVSVQALVESSIGPDMLHNWIEDCQSADQMPVFVAELLQRGFSRDELAALLGGNWMRVFDEVWGS
ncbi:MAG: dipeptidase [Anaerolineae bacterium]|nr:dipeptidase [Anaerolineae bacterium]